LRSALADIRQDGILPRVTSIALLGTFLSPAVAPQAHLMVGLFQADIRGSLAVSVAAGTFLAEDSRVPVMARLAFPDLFSMALVVEPYRGKGRVDILDRDGQFPIGGGCRGESDREENHRGRGYQSQPFPHWGTP